MTIQCLSPSAWREFRGTPSCPGVNNTTHLAKISDPTGKLHDCYVKLLPTNTPALLGEAVGWSLARAADVACPPFAAIIMVPLDKLRENMTLPSEMDEWEFCPAWCCELVPGKSMRQIHKWLYMLSLRKCLRSQDVKNIAAFDYWSDLRDRNMGNVIRSESGGYIAIDHETILHDILWPPAGKIFHERSLLAEAENELPAADFKKFQGGMVLAADKHMDALSAVRAEIERLINMIYPHLAATLTPKVTNMLDARAQKGWLAADMGVIA